MSRVFDASKGRKEKINPLFLVGKLCKAHFGGISEGVGSSGFSHTLMRSDARVWIHFNITYRESPGTR